MNEPLSERHCAYVRKNGKQCSVMRPKSSEFCSQHRPEVLEEEERRAVRKVAEERADAVGKAEHAARLAPLRAEAARADEAEARKRAALATAKAAEDKASAAAVWGAPVQLLALADRLLRADGCSTDDANRASVAVLAAREMRLCQRWVSEVKDSGRSKELDRRGLFADDDDDQRSRFRGIEF